VAFLERETEPVVGAAGVAHGREPLPQALLGPAHRAGRDVRRRVDAMLVGDVLGDSADVDVGVGEPGHERGALEVERGDGAGQRADLATRQDVPDAVVLDDDRGALLRVGAGAVDEERVRQDGQAHRATTFASYIQTFSSARGDHSTWLATP
jgi:hypothetical protein